MKKFEQGVLNTPEQHNVNSVIMERASDTATEETEKYCDLKSIKCWYEEDNGDFRFTEEAQDIFNKYYDDNMESLYGFVNDVMEAARVNELEGTEIKTAMNYLCDSEDNSISDQIELIKNHEDGEDFIDNVEGVIVWDKVVNVFTCNEFIDLISK